MASARNLAATCATALALCAAGQAASAVFPVAATAAAANPGGAVAGDSGTQGAAAPASTDAAGGTAPAPGRAKDSVSFNLGERTLRRGSRGSDVAQLQRLLAQVRLHTPATGVFDARTWRAVRRFQLARRLPVTGVVAAQTVAALTFLTATVPGSTTPAAGVIAQQSSELPVHLDWVFPIQPLSSVVAPSNWTLDQGVDMATIGSACGSGVAEVAVDDGTIVAEGISGFGSQAPILRIDAGPLSGRYVYYGHAEPALVAVGAHVTRGEPIADVGCGRVGLSSGPHLEIGINTLGGPTCCPANGATSPLMSAIVQKLYLKPSGW